MPRITISREDSETKGRYIAHVDGMTETAELSFSKANARLVIADHTSVPDTMRGLGIGLMLAESLVEEARHGGYQVLPLCPFVKAQSKRHPEWSDVIAT